MQIRKTSEVELSSALELILNVFMEFKAPDFSPQGVETFKCLIADEDKMKHLDFYGAFIDAELIGVIAMRNISHITMLFVKKEHHKKGVGTALFDFVTTQIQGDAITVNSSPYAVGFYHRIGFVDTDTQKEIDGIKFTPMRKDNI